VLAELKALARRENVTLYMLLLGAFQVLLMRYSGQHDVVVGSPVAGRHRTELEGLIGYFVNTLVLRGDLSGSPSFVELLARVRQVCLDAYAHQDLPFDRLVAELSPERDLSRNPLYQVLFALQNMPASDLALGELRAQRLPLDSATAKFDLSLSLTEHDAALGGVLEYSTQLFDAPTIERMARHYQRLLRAIAGHPEQSIARLPLMDEREREQLLFTWNDTAREYPLHQNLHQLFEAQVLRSSATPSSTPAPTAWRITCARWASAPMCWWACACSAAPPWWWRCWPS
jgi:non-ribosomal peptide synthetase component F